VATASRLSFGETTLTRMGLGTNRVANTPRNVECVRERWPQVWT
jgi:hypothetical protein